MVVVGSERGPHRAGREQGAVSRGRCGERIKSGIHSPCLTPSAPRAQLCRASVAPLQCVDDRECGYRRGV